MQPRFLTGDTVMVTPVHMTGSYTVSAMVISVQQANEVPDAEVRGLAGLQPWHYYVLTTQNPICGVRIMGPLSGDEVWPCPS